MTRDLQDKITGFWSTIASGYEAHPGNVPRQGSEEHAAWIRAVADLLPLPPADVLDIGTGTGFVAMIAATLGHRVTGIDLSEPMLGEARAESARRALTVRFAAGDAVAPALSPRSFDAVISRHLLWTLRDVHAALVAWRRLLRPGGRVIAIDGFWFEPESAGEEGFFESFYDREATLVLLERENPTTQDLTARLMRVLDPARHHVVRLRSSLPGPYALLDFELQLDWLVVDALENRPRDLVDWPGKGCDAPLYELGI